MFILYIQEIINISINIYTSIEISNKTLLAQLKYKTINYILHLV